MLTRQEKLLQDIDPASQTGVEIGPLISPIVTRDMGQIRYIDHANTEALRLKYADNATIDIDKIVEIDYVWGEKSLEELTHIEAPFDYLIASHVIEHVPDLVGWLSEIRTILKPGGILSLAIPDKRQCFDYKRQPTRLCDVLEAYLYRNRRPSPGQVFDHHGGAVTTDQDVWIWEGPLAEATELKTVNSLSTAWEITRNAFTSGEYYDAHCWVFTPSIFLGLLVELAELELLKFEVVRFHGTEGCEFFVSLRAVEHAVDQSAIQSSLAAADQLEKSAALVSKELAEKVNREKILALEEKLNLMESDMQALQANMAEKSSYIQAMESSKFWGLRTKWFAVKRKLGLPIQ
jgi:SAM-dependent methyltransferase